ncbi:putative cellobiose dehydrogenase [Aspergillus saccharolyticus JOP 1030-1]|uniref:FAD/NAD(P)-binding domain-containing protein n=1 Tax=Aspergillus saccharolyticus JOP 1030-1 TaxID=1450539 RepID=A0A318Z1W9_9EURO|nr:FAD/NAD(P)-binding domain-containing protein [Aspergillus saccharolyticus JOP 1030-1]PYH41285.1 FAD/NAD(P)-binding domain-containing protein [Aspergillus saccharolyticus JOP 1030-1]
MRSYLLSGAVALGSALGASASSSTTSAYSDSVSGMDFQRWCDSDTGFCFGIALPETVEKSFIGQLSVPLDSSKGWGGVSMSGSMTEALLIAAWPNGDSAVGTLRETSAYSSPAVYSGNASILEIPEGTSINSTFLTYTFLCENCILGEPTTFGASESTYYFGWGLSKTSPTSPSSASSAMPFHAAGYGGFEVYLSKAKSSSYATWAAKAVSSTTTASSSASVTSPSASASASVVATVANTTYDYIVVGGGAAGIVAAERLAETKKKVLLIERGVAPTTELGATDALSWNSSMTPFDIPALGSALTSLDLLGDYLCDDTAGMAGCVLGGGTIVNAESFIHPQEADFDDKWPTGWKWKDVQAAANRLYELNPGSTLPSADGKRYDQGMYTVLSNFLKGLGWKSVDSQKQPNEKHMVYSYPSWDVGNGIRAGPVRSYLPLVQDADNFSLRLSTKVRRLVRRSARVTGVEVETSSGGIEIINLKAGGKVVLAAGSMSTPRILFNSGIGPTKQIQTVKSGSTGITLPPSSEWINLPVGENLRDHPMFTVTVNTNSNFTHFNTSSVIPGPSAAVQKLFSEGSGVLTQGGHRLQFWTSNVGTDGITRFYQASCSTSTDGVITMKLYLTHGATSSGVLGIDSSGTTTLETNPWLTTAADKEALTRFFTEFLGDINNSTAGWSVSGISTASGLLDLVSSGDHYVGTAKIGTDDGRVNNGTSVVDLNTKVYGTENLYVVDASIHPDLPTGNTQAIVMIAAEAAVARIIAQGTDSVSVASSSVAVSAAPTAAAYASAAESSVAVSVATATAETTVTSVAVEATTTSAVETSSSTSSAAASDEDDDEDLPDCDDEDDEETDDATDAEDTFSASAAVTAHQAVATSADSGVSTTTVWVTSTAWTTTTEAVVTTTTSTVTVWPTYA